MENNLVNVTDPDTGEIGSIPAHQLQEALGQGFEQATPEQVHAYVNEQKYGGVGQQIITGLEGAGEAVSFGTSTGLERLFGVKGADIQGRRETNPVPHGVGQVAGLVGSAFVPGLGEANLLEHAGAAAAKAAIPGAEALYGATEAVSAAKGALKAASKAGGGVSEAQAALNAAKEARAAQPFLVKVGTPAADQAIQFALMQSGDEVSKMFSGAPGYEDPATAAQTALTNIGLSSVLGGATGAGFGVLSPLWQATVGQKAENFLTALRTRVNGETQPIAKGIEQAMNEANISPEIRAGLSENPMAAEHYKTLIESGTEPGQELRETIEVNKARVGDNLKSVFQTEENLSAFDAGEKAKNLLIDKAEELSKPSTAKYAETEASNQAIQIPDEARIGFQRKLIDDGLKFGARGGPAEGIFKNYADRMLAQNTVAEQDKLISEVWSDWKVANRAGDDTKKKALADIAGSMREFQDDQIAKAAKAAAGGDKLALAEADKYIADRLDARKQYKEFIENLGDMASVAKLGKGKMTLGRFQEALDSVPSAKLADKLFDKKNIEGLRFLKENHPDVLETIINQKKSEMLESSIKGLDKGVTGGEFKHSTLLDKVAKLPKEVRELMFTPEELSKIDNSARLLKRLNERINPSGTARGSDLINKHMPAGIGSMLSMMMGHNPIVGALLGEAGRYLGKEAPDAIKLSLLKFLGSSGPVDASGWKTAFDLIEHTYKAQKMINKASENIFKSGAEVLARTKYPSDDQRKRFEKRLSDLQTNQDSLVNVGGKTAQYLPDHGAALSATAVKAVNYLNSLKPNLDKKAPLDNAPKETPEQKARYNRALDIAEQPLILLNDIKEGTLVPQDLVHLNNLYPALYGQLRQKVMDNMIEAVHAEETIPYKTKLGLSLFVGQPLDSTMTPQALMALNPPPQAPQQMNPPNKASHSSMKDLGKVAQDNMTPNQTREARKFKA